MEDATEQHLVLELIESTTDYNTDFIACKGRLIHWVTFTKDTNPKEGIFWRQASATLDDSLSPLPEPWSLPFPSLVSLRCLVNR